MKSINYFLAIIARMFFNVSFRVVLCACCGKIKSPMANKLTRMKKKTQMKTREMKFSAFQGCLMC